MAFVTIPSFSDYKISKNGQVKSTRVNKDNETILLRPSKNSQYRQVALSKNGKAKTVYIHRLLAEIFIPNPLNKKTVNHKNGDKHDNALDNLEWASYSENNIHALKLGLRRPYTKIPDFVVRQIFLSKGTHRGISKIFGVSQQYVSEIKLIRVRKTALTGIILRED